MNNRKALIKIGIVLILTLSCSNFESEKKIAFPEELESANIVVDSLSDILNGSLIIGNGDINALLFSNDTSLVMNITKNDVWDARIETENDPPLPTLSLIKQLGATKNAFPLNNNNSGYVLPKGMKWEKKDSYHSEAYPCPRQCAQIIIQVEGDPGSLTGELDLKRAVANITGSAKQKIKVRALAGSNVFLVESTGKINLVPIISEGIPQAETGATGKVKWLRQVIPPDLDWEGMSFAVAVASSGNIKGISVVTSIESNDELQDAINLANRTVNSNVADLIEDHESIWGNYWAKSGIKINNEILQSTWYRSLYFYRCVSKQGVQSVGLFAGLINDIPAWHGDYHTNYNIQQTYWTAYPSNHPDIAEPYDRLIHEYLKRAKWLSNEVFSMKGAYYPHVLYAYESQDPALCKSRNKRQYLHHTWGMTIGVNGFSIQPLWWRYKYDPDPGRLKNIVYPVLKEVATFYSDFIESCEGDSVKRLGPSVSPEHWGWTKNLDRNYNCTFDIAYAEYTLKAAIEAAKTLNVDNNLIERFEKSLKLLPDYPISSDNLPVVLDVEGAPVIEYNIPVPSTPVFPADVVTWWSNEKIKSLFKRTIENLKWNGNNATFMLAIARSRLSMSGTIKWLENEIEGRLRQNGTIALNRLIPHRRFNDFGHYTEQFGAGMAVTENLLQSVDDIIRVFPSVERETIASFKDLRAQGGFLVSSSKSEDHIDKIEIKSLYGGIVRLLSPWAKIEAYNQDSNESLKLKPDERGIIKISTEAGQVWKFNKY